MAALDHNSLKQYVQGASSSNHPESNYVLLHISHSHLKQIFMEIRFDLHSSIQKIKEKVSIQTGSSVNFMNLQLFNESNQLIAPFLEDSRPLGFYSPKNGQIKPKITPARNYTVPVSSCSLTRSLTRTLFSYRIHVIDTDPSSLSATGWLDNTSLVQKYVMTDEDYDKREDSVRKFKEKIAAENPALFSKNKLDEDYMFEFAKNIKVGDRCEVNPGAKRGEVRFLGKYVEGLDQGWWVGVAFDEPVGKHDGTVKGKKLFDCMPGHGQLFRPDIVKVGDYPERDPFEDEDEDMDEI